MDKHNKYRSDLREHFFGSRNEPKRDKNGHRIPVDMDRPQRERYHYMENANLFSTHSIIREPRDNSAEHLHCPSGRCLHSQNDTRGHRSPPHPAPAAVKLSRNYDYDVQYYDHKHNQNYCTRHGTRKPSHNTRSHHRDTEPAVEKSDGCGDWLVYKNPDFREATSDRAEEPVPVVNDYNQKHYQMKGDPHHKDYEKARAHCISSDERLRQKYSFLSDDSSLSKKSKPSQNTIISAKSGKDLRSIICSQIQMQQVMEQSTRPMECKMPPGEDQPPRIEVDRKEIEKVSRPEKGTPTTVIKPKTPKGLPQNKEVVEEPDLDKLSTIDLSDMFTVSADDIVSSKVIEPMTRKIQRMYLNTLQEEMSILEYLGKVPRLVSQVYRETAVRDNRKSSDLK